QAVVRVSRVALAVREPDHPGEAATDRRGRGVRALPGLPSVPRAPPRATGAARAPRRRDATALGRRTARGHREAPARARLRLRRGGPGRVPVGKWQSSPEAPAEGERWIGTRSESSSRTFGP